MARRPQISVIGTGEGPEALMALARELGQAIVDQGWRIVCGGLGGVMAAAAAGGRASTRATGSDVIGIVPSFDATTANDAIDIVIPTGMSIARNVLVVASGDVVVALGGSSGTLSELAMAWQLGKPVVALDCGGGWAAQLAGQQIDERREDVIVKASSVDEAIAAIHSALG